MKYILLLLILLCSNAFAAITDLKLSTAQIFDVQWNISGGTLNASGFNYIYASVNYATQTTSAARWTQAQTADAGANGRYIGFFNSTTNPGTYGMAVFNSDGTRYKTINNTGSFRALANGAIFYNGNGMWGTLITTGQGYSLGQSGSWAVTQDYPSNTQLQAYTPPSDTPLAPGETAAPSSPPPPSLCCGGSSAAFSKNANNDAKVLLFKNRTTADNQVYVEQIGTSNTITVEQSGSYNSYAKYYGDGSSNTVVITQSSTAPSANNYVDLTIAGNANNASVVQQSTGGNKSAFVTINGNNNSLLARQTDNGNHYLEVNISGNNKSVTTTQSGSASHMASVTLGGPEAASVNLTQAGSTQQFYSINYNCSTIGGCGAITVKQGQ